MITGRLASVPHIDMGRKLVIVLGPTAVGKTAFSIELALKCGSPVISCDSRQIFREMTIGTAVPSASQLAAVKHYFIHSHSVTDNYTAGRYEVEALELIRRLFAEGHETLVMAGGSGFYIDAVCKGLDDFPPADQELRAALSERLRTEGVESLRLDLKRLDPESYESIDIANGQRVVRALEVCLMTGRKFSSFKTATVKSMLISDPEPTMAWLIASKGIVLMMRFTLIPFTLMKKASIALETF